MVGVVGGRLGQPLAKRRGLGLPEKISARGRGGGLVHPAGGISGGAGGGGMDASLGRGLEGCASAFRERYSLP